MTEILKPDLCVIGAGSGGVALAAAAAAMGVSVVLIERGEMGGGCLNHGPVPSRALIAAAAAAQNIRMAGRFGMKSTEPQVDFLLVRQHIRDVQAKIAANSSQSRFEAMGVRVIRAAARFTAPDCVEAGGLGVKARRFVVATGSSPAPLLLEGIDLVRPLTSESILELAELPPQLVIIGAGPSGLELAQAFRRLGSEVTVLETGSALAGQDTEMREPLLRQLTGEGMVVRENVHILRVEPRGTGVRLFLAGQTVEETLDGSHLLIAAGRRPNVDGLGLEAANVRFDKAGVHVSRSLRTSNRRVYAIGDAAGLGQHAHLATHHAGLVLRAAFLRQSVRTRPELVPDMVWCDPEIASIGLSETAAREKFRDIQVLRWPFSENDRAQAERASQGLVKVITDRRGLILGAAICGAGAGDMIAIWSLALGKGMKIAGMADVVHPCPTRGEISRQVAVSARAGDLRSKWLPGRRALFRWIG